MKRSFVYLVGVAVLAACSHTDPLEVSTVTPTATKVQALTDQAVIANAVGNSPLGADALAWANPSTGSAGVIEQVDAGNYGPDGCRKFVTSRQSLEGTTRFDGVACPSGHAWKLAPSTGLDTRR